MHRPGAVLSCLFALLLAALGSGREAFAAAPAAAAGEAWLLTLHDAVGPATADYIVRNLERAREQQVAVVVLEIDTPGGLDESMRAINQAILDSTVPVVCLVAPGGARAASAGTYILYACPLAAMAPATHLGAATPVAIGTPKWPEGPADERQPAESRNDGDAMRAKAVNDAAAYIRALAQLRGRNGEWAERAVREAVTLTAQEALAAGVIDLVAESPAELLQAIDGRRLTLQPDRPPVELHTAGLQLRPVPPDWRNQFLAVISNPSVAYVLMLIGIYGLILEFYHPGAILPGAVGGICLLLALYAFQVLPVNYSGLALILLGLALMLGEAVVTSFGVLGISGVAAFVIGSVLLFDSAVPGFGIAFSLILGFAVVSAALLILVIGMVLRARRRAPVSGIETWIGDSAEAIADFAHEGQVLIHGEVWDALTQEPVRRGQRLRVTAVEGLRLHVAPQTTEEAAP